MGRLIVSFIAGCLFGAGLLISEMTNPSKVIGFLDIFGVWDPSLAFVMASALVVTFIGYRVVLKKESPAFETEFRLPKSRQLDWRLISGAALFGIGWGLSGLCPGPAISLSTFGGENVLYFLAGMVGSVVAFQLLRLKRV